MAEAVKMRAVPAKPLKTNHLMKRVISYALLALVFFLLGFVPLWAKSREATARLSATEHALRLSQLQNALGSAAIDAQRGEYEPALLSLSQFYTSLQAELDRGAASAFSPAEQTALQPMFAGRDDLIALLARRDPAAGARLADLYQSYGQILAGKITAGLEAGTMSSRTSALAKPAP